MKTVNVRGTDFNEDVVVKALKAQRLWPAPFKGGQILRFKFTNELRLVVNDFRGTDLLLVDVNGIIKNHLNKEDLSHLDMYEAVVSKYEIIGNCTGFKTQPEEQND